MKNRILGFMAIFAVPIMCDAAPLTGFYQTIDDETNLPKSIVAIYDDATAENTIAGRVVAIYDDAGNLSETYDAPVKIADKVSGSPTFVGLDIIWNMAWDSDDNEYSGGKIMDPQNGKKYTSVIWMDDNETTLHVRGKIGPFGRTQDWVIMPADTLPATLQNLDTTNWKPIIRD